MTPAAPETIRRLRRPEAVKQAAVQLTELLADWPPTRLLKGAFLELDAASRRLIEVRNMPDGERQLAVYVVLDFDREKYFRQLVPHFRKVLAPLAVGTVEHERFCRPDNDDPGSDDPRRPPKAGQRFSFGQMVREEYVNCVALNTGGQRFSFYQLPPELDFSVVADAAGARKVLVVTVTLVDRQNRAFKVLSRQITEGWRNGVPMYSPLYSPLTRYPPSDPDAGWRRLLIAPEFFGGTSLMWRPDFNFHPDLVRRVWGNVTAAELQKLASLRIGFELRPSQDPFLLRHRPTRRKTVQ